MREEPLVADKDLEQENKKKLAVAAAAAGGFILWSLGKGEAGPSPDPKATIQTRTFTVLPE
jgi:hypothetical protein